MGCAAGSFRCASAFRPDFVAYSFRYASQPFSQTRGGSHGARQRAWRVWPLLIGDRPMPFPNLVALDIDDILPVQATC